MTDITDIQKLNKELSGILERVIDSVSNKLLEDFRRHLDDTIYASFSRDESEDEYGAKQQYYARNYNKGGFYAGWEIKKDQSSALKGYIRRLAFDGGKLVAPSYSNDLAHGGLGGRDVRGSMPWILNDIMSNDIYSYGGGAKYLADGGSSVGYWSSYLKDIDNKIEKWLGDEFRKYGISRR